MRKSLISIALMSTLFIHLITTVSATDSNIIHTSEDIQRSDYSSAKRIYDDANLFSDQEVSKLYDSIEAMEETYDITVLIVTITDNLGYSTADYASTFYDESLYGNEGIIILFDMKEREVYIEAIGEMMAITISDEPREKILDAMWDDVSSGSYGDATATFLSEVNHLVKISNLAGFERITYAFKKSITILPGAIGLAGIITAIAYFVSGRAGSLAKTKQYLKNGKVNMTRQEDRFLYSNTTSRHIPKPTPSNSSSHSTSSRSSSSSGSSNKSGSTPRSGGGRKF